MNETPEIHRAIIAAMRSIGPVGKEQEFNGGNQRYRYRGVDDIIDACGPALREAGVFPVPTILDVQRRETETKSGQPKPTMETIVRMRYDFTAGDGSSVSVTVEGESLDTSDKGTAKAASVAFRIALIQLFCIPTGDPDPDSYRLERDGPGIGLSPALADVLGAAIVTADASGLAAVGATLDERGAWDAPAAPDSEMTFAEAFAFRARILVSRIEAPADASLTWKALRPYLGMRINGGTTLAEAITSRVDEINTRQHDKEENDTDDDR